MKLTKEQKRTKKCPSGQNVIALQSLIIVRTSYNLNRGQVQVDLDNGLTLHLSKIEALRLAERLTEAAERHSESRS